jgi:periplasmic divalent cation tolerance protein
LKKKGEAMLLVYVTFPDLRTAKKICKILLMERLIACANVFRIRSLYNWKGKMNDTSEFVAIVKTENKNKNKLEKKIKELHPYEIPAIIYFNAKASKEFENWVRESVRDRDF